MTWEIEPQDDGICMLTLVHDRLEGAPKTAASVAGGWMIVLSGLKTLLETGEPLAGSTSASERSASRLSDSNRRPPPYHRDVPSPFTLDHA